MKEPIFSKAQIDRHKKVLSFISFCELLTPAPVPNIRAIRKVKGDESILNLNLNLPLPWATNDNLDCVYIICIGVVEISSLYRFMGEQLGVDVSEDDLDEISGKTYLARIKLDSKGCLLPTNIKNGDDSPIEFTDQFTGLFLSNQSGSVDLFDKPGEYRINEQIRGSLGLPAFIDCSLGSVDQYRMDVNPIDTTSLKSLISNILSLVRISNKMREKTTCTLIKLPKSEADSKDVFGMINSKFIEEISYLKENPEQITPLLSKYLNDAPSEASRLDLLQNKKAFKKISSIVNMPAGRWPSNPNHSLCLAQQAAVNLASSKLDDEYILGINGPPGTGKTTLLNDICAHVTVEKAKLIATFKTPDDLFLDCEGDVHQFSFPVTSKFGIVVTSSNNSAVENISNEQPLSNKVDKECVLGNEYFAKSARALLTSEKSPNPRDCWGLVAAALGNSANKKHFASILTSDNKSSESSLDFTGALYSEIKNYAGKEKPYHHWHKAKENFIKLTKQYDKIRMKDESVIRKTSAAIQSLLSTFDKSEARLDKTNLVKNDDHLESADNTKELNILRTKIYMAALNLQRLTISCNAEKFISNIKILNNHFLGSKIPNADTKHCWDTFFFMIPVASTTLAAFPSLFYWNKRTNKGMGGNSIGWVLVDEAGQATPQSLIPALWRATKRLLLEIRFKLNLS